MRTQKRLDRLRENALVLPFDNRSKIVMFSDCHRSNGSGADNFAPNENLYRVAMQHYAKDGYTYIELGDGDELWEGRRFQDIAMHYKEVFSILSGLHMQGRFYMLFGNHDMVKKRRRWVQRNLFAYMDEHRNRVVQLFPDIEVHESIVLRNIESGQELLLLHGHQADFLNYDLWMVARFLVRHVWRPLEMIGLRDPNNARASNSHQHRMSVEGKLSRWAKAQNQTIIAGHTHRAVYPDPEEALYFNDGCCVSSRYITALEIAHGSIRQVRWLVRTRDDGTLYVTRETNYGPNLLAEYHHDASSSPE